jgi:hypothetical protein
MCSLHTGSISSEIDMRSRCGFLEDESLIFRKIRRKVTLPELVLRLFSSHLVHLADQERDQEARGDAEKSAVVVERAHSASDPLEH